MESCELQQPIDVLPNCKLYLKSTLLERGRIFYHNIKSYHLATHLHVSGFCDSFAFVLLELFLLNEVFNGNPSSSCAFSLPIFLTTNPSTTPYN